MWQIVLSQDDHSNISPTSHALLNVTLTLLPPKNEVYVSSSWIWAGDYSCSDQWNSVGVMLCDFWAEVIKQYTFHTAPLMFTFGTWPLRCKPKTHREIVDQCFLQQPKLRSQPRAGINYQTCKWMRLQMILAPHLWVFQPRPQTSYGRDKLFLSLSAFLTQRNFEK